VVVDCGGVGFFEMVYGLWLEVVVRGREVERWGEGFYRQPGELISDGEYSRKKLAPS